MKGSELSPLILSHCGIVSGCEFLQATVLGKEFPKDKSNAFKRSMKAMYRGWCLSLHFLVSVSW